MQVNVKQRRFLKTKSEARTIFLVNSSDVPAPFEWITGVHREGQRSSGLEVDCGDARSS